MRRGTHALWILYGGLALALLAAALLASQRDQYPTAALLAAAAIALAMAIPHTSWLLDEVRNALVYADRATRPGRPPLTTRQDVKVQQILAAACCEVWWATAGAEHDPEHCTRKDQTT